MSFYPICFIIGLFNKKSSYFDFVDTMMVSHENLSCESFIEVTEIGSFSNRFEKILTVCAVFQWVFMWYAPSMACFNQTNLYFDTVDAMMVSCENLPSESCIKTIKWMLFNDWFTDRPFSNRIFIIWKSPPCSTALNSNYRQPFWILLFILGFFIKFKVV